MNVVWTSNAQKSYAKELEYIGAKWTMHEVVQFMDLVDAFVSHLKSGVIEGKISKKTTIRSFVISKQTTVYFECFEEQKVISLLLFWNNTNDPKNLKKLLQR